VFGHIQQKKETNLAGIGPRGWWLSSFGWRCPKPVSERVPSYGSPGTKQSYHPFWAYVFCNSQTMKPKAGSTWSFMQPLMIPQLILKQLEWFVGHQVICPNGQGGHWAVHLDGQLDHSLSCTTPWPTWPLRCRVNSPVELYKLDIQTSHQVCTAQKLKK
jgi:hypothetical protein